MSDSENLNINEISIIASIISDSKDDNLLTASQALVGEDFTDPRNKEIFNCLLEMEKNSIHADLGSLIENLKQNKKYEEIGGFDYLEQILDKAVQIGPIENYINIVKQASLLSTFLTELKTIQYKAENQPISNISEFIGSSEEEILSITQQRKVEQVMKLSEINEGIVKQLIQQTDDFKARGIKANGVTGIETGFAKMDDLTKGWHKGDMIVIGARPSVGKTAFALNLLYHVAKKGIPVLFFSLEMDSVSIARRLLSLTSQLSLTQIDSLEYLHGSTKDKILVNAKNSEEASIAVALQSGMNELGKLPFYIDDNPGARMMDISTKCKKLANSIKNIGLIAIDYLGLITSPTKGVDNRQQEVANISRQLKQLARQLNVPIIALSQLSRDSEKRDNHTPQISDIRDSGAIEQDADLIFMLYRKDYYDQQNGSGKNDKESVEYNNSGTQSSISQVQVKLLKNRKGQVGILDFIFDREHCSFNMAENSIEDTPF